ncbi:hypothetical protein ARMGADRAFT_543790 [Armillaria gallica]|uniref:Uncharacterized protein n=1 Tax=Armillaria gallica TaxID=47427 RepID=A0A2H3DCP3_ARMGA|nr:hypothetical protein ARMGADRAFT_543790 [Armillaria gallica]
MCGRVCASLITLIGYDDIAQVATYSNDVTSENRRKAEEIEDDVDILHTITMSSGTSQSRTGDGERG